MTISQKGAFVSAVEQFRRARSQADLELLMARLTGRSAELLSYEEVQRSLKAAVVSQTVLTDIPLDAIVGSVGRYTDFTRSFLPRLDSDQQRWAQVQVEVIGPTGLPPIDVYQIGETYFVKDGNHRVSVAKELGATHIEAYVTEVKTRVPLTPEVQPDDLILKAELTDFLAHTGLDETRPQAELSVSIPGQYAIVENHIAVHRHYMGLEQEREIPYEEAAAHWYDVVYAPIAQFIEERGILHNFPKRTALDLYLWVADHRSALEEELGWEIDAKAAVTNLESIQGSARIDRVVGRVASKVLDAVVPDGLEPGPPPDRWRLEHPANGGDSHLLANILVPVTGQEVGWHALTQALEVARREQGRLRGLHVVAEKEEEDSEAVRAIRVEFERRCQEAGIPGQLAVETGNVARRICERTQWADLTVLRLAYPPPPSPIARLGSGFRTLLRRCGGPLLVVPQTTYPLQRPLLAYDNSRRAQEALFLAAYLAGRWETSLVVATVSEEMERGAETIVQAREYLESCGLEATYITSTGPVVPSLLDVAAQQQNDLIILGGYGTSPMVEVIRDSNLNEMLRISRLPMLICR